jgi:hypothetical protein
MYSEFRSPSQEESSGAYDWSRATACAIDLAISSGLFLAPRRVLLEMAAELKRQADEPAAAGEMELLKAA